MASLIAGSISGINHLTFAAILLLLIHIQVADAACGTTGQDCSLNGKCAFSTDTFSFGCECVPGFRGDGVNCTDVDECAEKTDDCDNLAFCTNTEGGFTCSNCPQGYQDTTGDGKQCKEIDECENSPCKGDNSTCINTDGSFECKCPDGWSGDGITFCADGQACPDSSNICPMYSECKYDAIDNEWACRCQSGFQRQGDQCVDIDECLELTDSCDNNAKCSNTLGSFDCACKQGYKGDGMKCTADNAFKNGTLPGTMTSALPTVSTLSTKKLTTTMQTTKPPTSSMPITSTTLIPKSTGSTTKTTAPVATKSTNKMSDESTSSKTATQTPSTQTPTLETSTGKSTVTSISTSTTGKETPMTTTPSMTTPIPVQTSTPTTKSTAVKTAPTTRTPSATRKPSTTRTPSTTTTSSTTRTPSTTTKSQAITSTIKSSTPTTLIKISQKPTLKTTTTQTASTTIQIQTSTTATIPKTTTVLSTTQTTAAKRSTTTPPTTTSKQTTAATQTTKEPTTSNPRTNTMTTTTDMSTQSTNTTSMQPRSETPKPTLFTTSTDPITKTITAEKPSNMTKTHTITPATTASTKRLSETTELLTSTTSNHNHSTSTQITRVLRRCPAKEMVDCPSFDHACSTSFYVREICPITCGTCDTKTGTTVEPTSPRAISTGFTVTVATATECPDQEDVLCISLKKQCKSSFYVRALCPISCGTCGTQPTATNKAVSSGSQTTSTRAPITRKSTTDGSTMRTLPPCPEKEDLECVTLGKLCDESFLVQVRCPISCGKCNSGTIEGSTSENPLTLSTAYVSAGQNATTKTVPKATTKLPTTHRSSNNNTDGIKKLIPLNLPLRISQTSSVDQFRIYRETMVEQLEAYYERWSNVSNADCIDISSVQYQCEVSWEHTSTKGFARRKRATSDISDLDEFLTNTFENALKEKAKKSNITAPAIISPDGTTTSAGNELTTTDQPISSTTTIRPNTTIYRPTSSPSVTTTQGRLTTDAAITVTDEGGLPAKTTPSSTEKQSDGTSQKPAGTLCPDINNVCSENSKCIFVPAGFRCDCKDGFTEDGNGVCIDVDECTLGTNNCDSNAKCLNTDGSFACSCNNGFAGNGVLCTPSNETQVQTTTSTVTAKTSPTIIPTKSPSTKKSTTASTPSKSSSKVTTTQVTTTPTTTTSSTSTTARPPTTTTSATSPQTAKTSSSTTSIPSTTEDTKTSTSASTPIPTPTTTSIPTKTTKTSTTATPTTKPPSTTTTTEATSTTQVSTSTPTPTMTKEVTTPSSITTTKEDTTTTTSVSASTQAPASSSTSTSTRPDATTPVNKSTTDASTSPPVSGSTSTLTTTKQSGTTPSSITTATEDITTTQVSPSTATPGPSSKVTSTTTNKPTFTTQNTTAPSKPTTKTTDTGPTVSSSISTPVSVTANTPTSTVPKTTTSSSNNTTITDTETTSPVATSTRSTKHTASSTLPGTTTMRPETSTKDLSTTFTDLSTESSSTQQPKKIRKIVTNNFQIVPPIIKSVTESQYIVIRVAISYTVEGTLKGFYKSETDLTVSCTSSSNKTYSCETAFTEVVTSSRQRRAVGSVTQSLLDNIQVTLQTNLQDGVDTVSKDIVAFKDRVTGVTDSELQRIQDEIDANSVVTTDLIDSSKTVTVIDLVATPLKQSTLPPVSTITTDVITTNKTCDFWWIGADCLDVDYKSSAFIGIMIACAILVIIVMITVVVAYHSRKKARGQRRGGKSMEDDLWINRDEDGDILNMRRISKLIPDDLDMKIPRAQIRESKDMNGNSALTNGGGGGEVQQSVRFNGAVAWSADKPRDPRIHSQDEITQLQSFAKGVPAADYVP